MPKPLSLALTAEQRRVLEDARAHDPKPYMREKAAALLKVADGASARRVAAFGLLTKHRHRTISRWAERFLDEGGPEVSVMVALPAHGHVDTVIMRMLSL